METNMLDVYRDLVASATSVPVSAQWAFARMGVPKGVGGQRLLAALMARPDLDEDVEAFIWGKTGTAVVLSAWLSRPGLSTDRIRELVAGDTRKTVFQQVAALPGLPDELYVRACRLGGVRAAADVLSHAESSDLVAVALEAVMSGSWNSLSRASAYLVQQAVQRQPNVSAGFVGAGTDRQPVYGLLWSCAEDLLPESLSKLSGFIRDEGRALFDRLAATVAASPVCDKKVCPELRKCPHKFNSDEYDLVRSLADWAQEVDRLTAVGSLPASDDMSDWSELVDYAISVVSAGERQSRWNRLLAEPFYQHGIGNHWTATKTVLNGWVAKTVALSTQDAPVRELLMSARSLEQLSAVMQASFTVVNRSRFTPWVRARCVELLSDPARVVPVDRVPSLRSMVHHRKLLELGARFVDDGHWDAARVLASWMFGYATWVEYVMVLVERSGKDPVDVFSELIHVLVDQLGPQLAQYAAISFAESAGVDLGLLVARVPAVCLPLLASSDETAAATADMLFSQVSDEETWQVLTGLWLNMPSRSVAEVLSTAEALT